MARTSRRVRVALVLLVGLGFAPSGRASAQNAPAEAAAAANFDLATRWAPYKIRESGGVARPTDHA